MSKLKTIKSLTLSADAQACHVKVEFRIEAKIVGHKEPMVDWYKGATEAEALALHDEDCHRYGIPMDKMTVTIRPATAKELEIFQAA